MTRKILLIGMLLFASVTPLHAEDNVPSVAILADIILYRPVGFAATLVGSAIFVGISPLTAFASIPAPHDAFQKAAQFLILAPGSYTFERPVGVYYPQRDGSYTSK